MAGTEKGGIMTPGRCCVALNSTDREREINFDTHTRPVGREQTQASPQRYTKRLVGALIEQFVANTLKLRLTQDSSSEHLSRRFRKIKHREGRIAGEHSRMVQMSERTAGFSPPGNAGGCKTLLFNARLLSGNTVCYMNTRMVTVMTALIRPPPVR